MASTINALRRAEIGRQRRDRTHAALIAAAARVIARLGEDQATIDAFITEADVARGTFYNYFPTKEDLIAAVWAYVGKSSFQHIHAACAKLADPAERITAELRLVAAFAAVDETWGWIIFSLSGREEANADLKRYPAPALRAGLRAGRFQIEDFDSARDLVVTAARTVLRATLEHRASPAYAMHFGRMLLLGLGLDAADAAIVSTAPLPELRMLASKSPPPDVKPG
jgi:AcrR family transcriptional regulator